MQFERDRLVGALAILLKKLPLVVKQQMIAEGEAAFIKAGMQKNTSGLTRAEFGQVFSKLARHVKRLQGTTH